jgi:hypothetical protein
VEENKQNEGITEAIKKAPWLAVIPLVSALLGASGVAIVSQDEVFTHTDWEREKAALESFAEAKHSALSSQIRSEIAGHVREEMRVIKEEVTATRVRMDKLIEANARMSAMVEQYIYIQGIQKGTKPRLNTDGTMSGMN